MNAAKVGIRRKWQATVKNRSEPPSALICSAEEEWNQQWKTLWRDIGKDALPFCPSPQAIGRFLSYSCSVAPELAEGGEDYEALVGPIAQHDKEVMDILLQQCLRFRVSALGYQ